MGIIFEAWCHRQNFATLLPLESLGANFSEISIEILAHVFKKMHLKISSVKRQLIVHVPVY